MLSVSIAVAVRMSGQFCNCEIFLQWRGMFMAAFWSPFLTSKKDHLMADTHEGDDKSVGTSTDCPSNCAPIQDFEWPLV